MNVSNTSLEDASKKTEDIDRSRVLPFIFDRADIPQDWQVHLAAIVESSDDAIISKDLDGIIRSWNSGAQRIFGYTADEIIGKHISTLAAPDVVDEIPNILEKLAQGQRIDHYQTKRKTKDGRILSISITVSPIRDGSGRIVGASKIARDVTNEHRYSELRAHLAAIVESSDDAIIGKDLNGIIQSWNRGAERIFGYTSDEIIGKHISTLAVPERVEEIPSILKQIAAGQSIDHYLTKRRTKDGRVLSVSLTISPIRDSTGRIVGASKIARDVTAQEGYERALREANESLQRSNADLEQFAYSASHDLQEPLRTLTAYSELLQKKFRNQLGSVGEQYVSYIAQAAVRMEELLDGLRAYTHASHCEAATKPADTNQALRRALASLQSAIQENGATINCEDLPSVQVSESQLEQLFQNLIGNAIRYRSEQTPQIHIGVERDGGAWRFSVRDNGIGIDPQYNQQIFGIFKRLHSVADYPGTGMGLAICERIVQRAGGRIWVESRLGQGATFFFTIPAAE